MAEQLARTSWRELQIDHPPQWEVAVASGCDAPGRLVLADRLYHRIDVRWKPLKYVPNLELMLARYKRRDKDDKTFYADLSTAPPDWKGVVHKVSGATIVHAGRFFRSSRILTEATIVWPGGRSIELENRILASVKAAEPGAQLRLWQAMGLSVTCPARYDLREASLKVGRIQWDFWPRAGNDKAAAAAGQLRVERIAMPDYLLKGRAVREWLAEELPAGSRQLRQRLVGWAGHQVDELVSIGKAPLSARLGGMRLMRLDLAWRCPIEQRIYHVTFTQCRRDEQIVLPEDFAVRCCRPVFVGGASRNVG